MKRVAKIARPVVGWGDEVRESSLIISCRIQKSPFAQRSFVLEEKSWTTVKHFLAKHKREPWEGENGDNQISLSNCIAIWKAFFVCPTVGERVGRTGRWGSDRFQHELLLCAWCRSCYHFEMHETRLLYAKLPRIICLCSRLVNFFWDFAWRNKKLQLHNDMTATLLH